jgi:hypothetical protein
MKANLWVSAGLIVCLTSLNGLAVTTPQAKVPYSSLAQGLEWVGVAVAEPDYTIWGAAPILGEDGKIHLFVARWPETNVDPAWRKSSEIAHYVADHPEGPFRFCEVVLQGSGRTGQWDAFAPHNPEIKRFGKTYALLYIANSDYRQPHHPLNQSIGMLLSESLHGPWRKAGQNGLILDDAADPRHWTHGLQVVNPAITKVKDQFFLYFKSRYQQGTGYGLAIADRLEGPYRMEQSPLTTDGIFIEDATVFSWNNQVHLLTTDNKGHVTGIRGGGALWVSDDGRHFNPKDVRVAYDRITAYMPDYDAAQIKRIYGGDPKLERPKVLMLEGQPAYLYGPSGWAVHGGERTACYVLRIKLPSDAHGTGKAYSIVTSVHSTELERRAATVLQDYLQRMCGVTYPVISERRTPGQACIYVGNTIFAQKHQVDFAHLKDDGYALKTVGQDLIIAGGRDRGVLYGVYSLLEELGCRKYTSVVTIVPKLTPGAIQVKDRVHVPKIGFREVLYRDAYDPEYADWHKLDAHRDTWGGWCHTFNRLVPPETHAATHPEYYALVNGKRQFSSQLCLSNPKVLEIVVKNLQRDMAKRPELHIWSVSQNDNQNYCQCQACSVLDEREGGPTGSVLNFVNQVARHFPDKTISTLAYQYSRSVPKTIKPEANVNIMLCNIESERHQPVPVTDPAFAEDLKNWGSLTKNIIVWDYIIQFKNLISPFPNLHQLKPNIAFFVNHNVSSLFEQGNREIGGEMCELRAYLTAKLMWDPDADDRAIIRDFLYGYYGKAGPFIERYVELQDQSLRQTGHRLGIFGNPVQAKHTYLSPANMKTYGELFDRAEAAVQHEPQLRDRVRICRLPLMYAALEIARTELTGAQGLYRRNQQGQYLPKPEIRERLQTFVELCNHQGVTRIKEWSTTPDEYFDSYRRLLESKGQNSLSLHRPIIPITEPSTKYLKAGVKALTDGMFGSYDYAVNWLGYEGEHMRFILDLGELIDIRRIKMDFLQSLNDWIFLPEFVQFSLSDTGEAYTRIARVPNPQPVQKKGIFIQAFEVNDLELKARYLRVDARNPKHCPAWHIGAGGPAWIFSDEITVE